MTISNIDEMLMGGGQSTPLQATPPENKYVDHKPEPIEELEPQEPDYEEEETSPQMQNDDANDEESEDKPSQEMDEYGNEKEPENKEMRERLKRQAKKFQSEIDELRSQLASQGASREIQNAAKDFEYDPESSGDWQQQLASFVKQTVSNMGREQEEAKARHQESESQRVFEDKFREGMSRFDDFKEVMTDLPFQITNPMTLATRAMENPAAFLYAAAKRNPQELERISKIRDPYAQMTEMGKLEERMRRNKQTTKAPRPLGRTNEDSSMPQTKAKKEPTIEDLIAKSDAKRLANVKQRGGLRR